PMNTLSGGNQQKVLLAKWLAGGPPLLLAPQPTHPVGVRARHDIVVAIADVAAEGCGVVVASSDPHELAALCDRVLIFSDGRVVEELDGDLSVDAIGEATFRRAYAAAS